MTVDPAEVIAEAFDELADWWTELHADLMPGTPRRWSQKDHPVTAGVHDCGAPLVHAVDSTPETPRVFCAACWSVADALGASAAPLRVAVLDVLAAETPAILELEDEVRERLGDGRPDRMLTVRAAVWTWEPDPRVPAACGYLSRQAARIRDHRDPRGLTSLAEHAVAESRRLLAALHRGLGAPAPVRRLDAACPVCGTQTLRAWVTDRERVTCTNLDCRCDREGCGCHNGRPHTWWPDDYPWLARVLNGATA